MYLSPLLTPPGNIAVKLLRDFFTNLMIYHSDFEVLQVQILFDSFTNANCRTRGYLGFLKSEDHGTEAKTDR